MRVVSTIPTTKKGETLTVFDLKPDPKHPRWKAVQQAEVLEMRPLLPDTANAAPPPTGPGVQNSSDNTATAGGESSGAVGGDENIVTGYDDGSRAAGEDESDTAVSGER
jgi:hypothetical protein